MASEKSWRYAFLHHAGWGGAVIAGPGNSETAAAAGGRRGSLRASHADRDQVIGTLQAAFVQGMLAKDEFDVRVGQALTSLTYAELAAVTTDLAVNATAAQSARAARAQDEGEKPVLRPGYLAAAATALYGGVWAFTFLPGWPTNSENDPPKAIVALFGTSSLVYLLVMVIAVGFMIAGWREKRSGSAREDLHARGNSATGDVRLVG
jgi:hypothetical protein